MARAAGCLAAAAGSGQLRPWGSVAMGEPPAAALGSQTPSPVAGPGSRGGAQVCGAQSVSSARV